MTFDFAAILLGGLKLLLAIVLSKYVIIAIVGLVLLKVLLHYLDRDFGKIFSWNLYRKNPTIPDVIKNMSGQQFESWVQGLFQKIGADAQTIGGIGDHGIDLIVKYQGKKIAVQCKKYYKSFNNGKYFSGNVGEPIVRNLYGSQHGGGYDKSILITTGYYSQPAKEWVKGKTDIVLIGRQELQQIINEPERLKKYL